MKFSALVLLCAGLLVFVTTGFAETITVESTEGDVSIARTDAEGMTPAEAGMKLNVGDEVHTGFDSQAVLEFENNSIVTVESLTQFRIHDFKTDEGQVRTRLQMKIGELRAEVQGGDVRSDFVVDTPNSTTAVEGTIPVIKSDPIGDRHYAQDGAYVVQYAVNHHRWFYMTGGRKGIVKRGGDTRGHRQIALLESKGDPEPIKGAAPFEDETNLYYHGRRGAPWLHVPFKPVPGSPSGQKDQQDRLHRAIDQGFRPGGGGTPGGGSGPGQPVGDGTPQIPDWPGYPVGD